MEELRKEYDDLGVQGRPLKVTMMPGANHFVSIIPSRPVQVWYAHKHTSIFLSLIGTNRRGLWHSSKRWWMIVDSKDELY